MTLGRCPLSIFCSRGNPSGTQQPLFRKENTPHVVHAKRRVRNTDYTKKSVQPVAQLQRFSWLRLLRWSPQGPSLKPSSCEGWLKSTHGSYPSNLVRHTCNMRQGTVRNTSSTSLLSLQILEGPRALGLVIQESMSLKYEPTFFMILRNTNNIPK